MARIHRGKSLRRWLILAAGAMFGGCSALAAAASVVETPEQAQEAFQALSPDQQSQLGEIWGSLLQGFDTQDLLQHFDLDQVSGSLLSRLRTQSLSELLSGASTALPALPLLPSFRFETESQGIRRSQSALFNVPTLLDVDAQAGPDVVATLSLTASGVNLSVRRLALVPLLAPALPLKIEAVVQDPRGDSTQVFAFGYDALASSAPGDYSETITVTGSGSDTTLEGTIAASSAGTTLAVIGELFQPGLDGSRTQPQRARLDLTPVPASTSLTIRTGGTVLFALGASTPTVAKVTAEDLRSANGPALVATIQSLPSDLRLQLTESNGARRLSYTASAPVERISADARNLPLQGRARQLLLALDDLPQTLSLNLGAEGSSFDLDTQGATLGRLEAVITSGPVENVPASFDGVLLKNLPDRSVLGARISGLKRVSGTQNPLSVFLDSVAGRPFRAELRDQPTPSAKQTYTIAELRNLQRNTRFSVSDASGRQEISYSADGSASSVTLDTNSGSRQQLTASIAPMPRSLTACSTGDNRCSSSGRPGNRGSFRLVSSEAITVNLFDCQAGSCSSPSRQFRLNNLRLRLVDAAISTGQSCTFLGCLPEGSSGNIWLDTDWQEFTGSLVTQDGGNNVSAYFPPGFRTDNRYVSWSFFIPSKSGAISCPSGTQLNVTVFGIVINVAGLYLC